MKTDYRVILIVDRSYGERLQSLPEHVPVWVVDSQANGPAVRDLRNRRPERNHLSGITSFVDKSTTSPEELAESILATIDLHHGIHSHNPPWNILEIIGAEKKELLTKALRELGFSPVTGSAGKLEWRREEPA